MGIYLSGDPFRRRNNSTLPLGRLSFIVSGAFLYNWRRVTGDARPTAAEWRSAATVGIFLLLDGNGGVVWASQFIPSSLAALLVATVPLWMVAIDSTQRGKQRPSVPATVGILIGFGGVVLLIRFAASDALVFNLFGTTAVLFASLSWAIRCLYARTAKLPHHSYCRPAWKCLPAASLSS